MAYDKSQNPDEVFHHTGTEGFQRIVESQTMHASNILFLNDRKELRYVDGYITSRVASRFREVYEDARAKGAMKEKFDPELIASLDAQRFIDVIHRVSMKLAPIFVLSFCRAADEAAKKNGLLSQWRGYGVDGGLAMSLSTKELMAIINSEAENFQYQQCKLCDVIYGENDPEFETIKHSFDEFPKGVPELVEDVLNRHGVKYRFEGERGSIDGLYDPYTNVAPRLKHPGFGEELEYRTIFPVVRGATDPPPKSPRKEIRFKRRDNYLLPYIEINERGKHRLPITSVIIGPSREADRRKESLSLFLTEHGYDVPVYLSEIPFA